MAKDTGFQDIAQVEQLVKKLVELLKDSTKELSKGATSTVKKNVTEVIAGMEMAQEEALEALAESAKSAKDLFKEALADQKKAEEDYLAARKARQQASTDAEKNERLKTEQKLLGQLQTARRDAEDAQYNYQVEQFKKVELEKRKQYTKTLKEQTTDNSIQYRAQLAAKRQAEKEVLEDKKRQLELEGKAETAQYRKVQKELEKLEKDKDKHKAADEKKAKKRAKADAIKAAKEQAEAVRQIVANKSLTKDERLQKLEDMGMSREEAKRTYSKQKIANGISGIRNVAQGLTSDIEASARLRGSVDTRLQGSRRTQKEGSYWADINSNIVGASAISPIVSQRQLVDNTKQLIDSGIAFNVEQRAALMTLSDRIASTFEAADGTLLRLIRIQQADTTAARLGMESALTAFLNNMYETTEYMSGVARDIRANIAEATALMGATEAVEFEYQVQK